MRHLTFGRTLTVFGLSLVLLGSVAGCAGSSSSEEAPADAAAEETVEVPVEESDETAALANGTYAIEVDTDSSMFHADSCLLTVEDGTYTAALVLPGEGFSRLYYGAAEEAAAADDADIYDYYLNDEGKYTFDIPVAALDEELTIAAFGHRRDTWYDHTITFHAPAEDAVADAA